jgi:hypothetical protein
MSDLKHDDGRNQSENSVLNDLLITSALNPTCLLQSALNPTCLLQVNDFPTHLYLGSGSRSEIK